MLTGGVWADMKVGDEHVRLFSEHNAIGIQASVYNVKAKRWIAPSEPVADIEQGKERAAQHALAFLNLSPASVTPPLIWKDARSL